MTSISDDPCRPTRDDLLAQLDALQGRCANAAMIEQAKGALMVTYGLTADEAFDVLRLHSQTGNVKLRAIAAELTALLSTSSTSSRAISRFDRLIQEVRRSLRAAGPRPKAANASPPLVGACPWSQTAADPTRFGTGDVLATMADQFGQLAVSLAAGADQPLTQQRIVEFAARGIPGAEHASMTVVDGKRPPRTTAGSDQLPYEWDQLQYDHGEGPCLDAIATNGVMLASDLRTDNRWPRFTRAIVDHTPARSMLSFRLFLTEHSRAGLNLYATRPAAFTDQSTATGSMFAAYASMALVAAARHDTANHLLRALETNREIGVAMGILMANGKLTSQQAFDQLSTASQNLNRKLHDIAADVARTGLVPAVPLKLVRD